MSTNDKQEHPNLQVIRNFIVVPFQERKGRFWDTLDENVEYFDFDPVNGQRHVKGRAAFDKMTGSWQRDKVTEAVDELLELRAWGDELVFMALRTKRRGAGLPQPVTAMQNIIWRVNNGKITSIACVIEKSLEGMYCDLFPRT